MMPTGDETFRMNRRAFLGRYAGALGSLALAHLLERGGADPLAPPPPHHAAKAKAVICLFQHGGPSQMDLFDPKPELTKQHGKPHPDKLEVHFHTQQGKLLASPFKFAKRGKSGRRAVGAAAAHRRDRGRHHAGAVDEDRLGRSRGGAAADPLRQGLRRPAGVGLVGRCTAWAPSTRNCRPTSSSPTPAACPWTGPNNWSSGFLPAVYQGTPFRARRHAGRSPRHAARTCRPTARAEPARPPRTS